MSLYANQAAAKGVRRSSPGADSSGGGAGRTSAATGGGGWDNDSESWDDIEGGAPVLSGGKVGVATVPNPKKEKSFLDDW